MERNVDYITYCHHSQDNEIEILTSKKAGCFFCGRIFSAREIHDWKNSKKGATALCPYCGVAAVIGDSSKLPLTPEILRDCNGYYFSNDYLEKHPEIAKEYVKNYTSGTLAHNKENEKIFIRFLKHMMEKGDTSAALALADIYEHGGEFISADPAKALEIYYSPILRNDAEGLLGVARLIKVVDSDGDYAGWHAYECIAKAAALGSFRGVLALARCYFSGYYVHKDAGFGLALLLSAWPGVYSGFCTNPKNSADFIEFSEEIGHCYYCGLGVEKDYYDALRYYLYAELGIETQKKMGTLNKTNAKFFRNVRFHITSIGKKLNYTRGEIQFDQDTFYDSFALSQDPYLPKRFHNPKFDPKSGNLSFDVTYIIPPLIVDLANMSCGFFPGTINWQFNSVAEFNKFGKDCSFEKITSHDDDCWYFEHESQDGNSITIASIRFYSNPDDIETIRKRHHIMEEEQ